MAPRARVISSSSNSSASSPSRPQETTLEIAYNTAVQSFVRRDHIKTQASISRLLQLLDTLPRGVGRWYDLENPKEGDAEGDEWRIKILKLVISANASLFADPPLANMDSLDPEIIATLPPHSPILTLERTRRLCTETLKMNETDLLPPPIVSTLLLASLKLQPPSTALDFAHRLTEQWLSNLPDELMRTLSLTAKASSQPPQVKKRIESTREGYLKVIELFVGEVLVREGEFGMARSLLDGEEIMSSKRKEGLYRHLRAMETKSQSPSSSGMLPAQSPSASLVLPQPSSRSSGRRSRSSTTSSSSSERTARPNQAEQSPFGAIGKLAKDIKNKGIRAGMETDGSVDTHSTFHVPDKLYINPSTGPSSSSPHNTPKSSSQRNLNSLLGLIPPSLRKRLLSPWTLAAALPIPFFTILFTIIYIRRRWLRLARVGAGAVVSGSVASSEISGGVRERLRMARGPGLRVWLTYWLRWWWGRVVGVWRMGTTITYL